MSIVTLKDPLTTDSFTQAVKRRSDKLMHYFLIGFFLTGLIFATFYDTWMIAFGVGGLCLVAYYLCKTGMPGSTLYQYVLSAVLGIFMAQYIYQMHGMFEMHFFAFIGSAVLITYQNWKLQIPMMAVVVIHHSTLSYLQNIGVDKVYFSQLDYFDLQTFTIHILLSGVIFFICGLWAYQLKKYSKKYLHQSLKMMSLQKEANALLERKENADKLEKAYLKAEAARSEAEFANLQAAEANIDLARKNKELEQFAYIASHDLQEPLRTTSSFAGLLHKQYQGKLDEKADKYFNYIIEASDRMKVLIKNLLDYSRIGLEKELEQIDCNVILNTVIADLHAAIQEAGAQISYATLPVISGYATEIKQLFQNLLINAIKFRKTGSAPIVSVTVRKLNGDFQFAFKDSGIGIEKQNQEKIFNIFQRLHSISEYEGSGIGLSYCKKIVELHNGKIWVESIPGIGSTFYFTIRENTRKKVYAKEKNETVLIR